MRGFGLTIDGVERFRTTQSIDMGGATVSRSVYVNTSANWGRWLDTFTNTTKAPVTIRVAFGRPSGQGTTGATTSAIVATSSGDAVVTPEDAWVEYATPLLASTLVGGPQVTVLGTPSPFSGAMTFAGNWLYDSFDTPLAYSGHERNFQAYVNTLTLPPRTSLASNPPLGDLSAAELCSVANFDIAAMSVPGFNHASCSARKLALVQQPPVPRQKEGEDRRQVRRRREDDAYQLVARDAMAQAKVADKAGAVIIGKTALEKYATFGHWSNDAWDQVWSVFNPSRSPLASSGGSASAVAGSFSAAAMGSQTGDSLYAPASAQSLVTLRGTDGLESGKRSRGSGHARQAFRGRTRRLAYGARRRRAAGQADRLRRCGVGGRLRPAGPAVRHQRHDRRDEERAPAPRGSRRDDRADGPARHPSHAGRA